MTAGYPPHNRFGLAVILAALSMVSPFSIDTFFPSFHQIAAQFGLSKWAMQQTITVYMLPLSFMSLIQGPLSDSLGRRRVIVAGIAVYAVASVGCALAPSFAALLLFRVLQGASAGVGMIVGRAVVRDLYDGPQAQKLLSMITMLFGFAPAVAPVLGGWIQVTLGWRAVFGFMALFGAATAIATYVKLPETHPPERRPRLHVPELARTALRVAAHREFMLLGLAMGANFATMMAFIGAAPFVVLDHWHLSETQFARLFAPVIGGFVSGAWVSGQMAGRLPPAKQCNLGFTFALSGAVTMVTLQYVFAEALPILAQECVLFVMAVGVQLIGPILALRMLDLFPRARGSAASVQSCLQIVVSALVFGFLAPLLSSSLLILAAGSLCASLLAFGLWRLAQQGVSLAHA